MQQTCLQCGKMQNSLQAPKATDCLVLHLNLISPTRRGRVVDAGCCMIEIAK